MQESIILACKVMDAFGLPGAVGNLQTDRFVVANDSFLRAVAFRKDEIYRLPLSSIVKLDVIFLDEVEIGSLIPTTVRSSDQGPTIGGHAAIGSNGLVYLMIPEFTNSRLEYEVGAAVGKELERQKVASYVHEHLGPDIMAVIFSIESIRTQLENEKHPSAAKLQEIQQRLTELLQPLGEEIKRRGNDLD